MELTINPIIGRVLETDTGDGIVEIEGFIGMGNEDTVRVYKCLEMKTCWDIPVKGIVHVEDSDSATEPSKLFVRSDTKVVEMVSRTVEAGGIQSGDCDGSGNVTPQAAPTALGGIFGNILGRSDAERLLMQWVAGLCRDDCENLHAGNQGRIDFCKSEGCGFRGFPI